MPINIFVQTRDEKGSITLIEGIPQTEDVKKILAEIKELFHTNGCIIKLKETSDTVKTILQIKGDLEKELISYFRDKNIL